MAALSRRLACAYDDGRPDGDDRNGRGKEAGTHASPFGSMDVSRGEPDHRQEHQREEEQKRYIAGGRLKPSIP